LVFTTTKTRIHDENETRVLSLSTDDSPDQTKRVLQQLANEDDAAGGDLNDWREFQKWLASDKATRTVTIPYAPKLAELINPAAVRLRRDFAALLALIRTHALLHQVNRKRDEQGRVIATIADYAAVRELVAGTIAEGVGQTVSDTVRATVETVGELQEEHGAGVTNHQVAELLKVDKSNASRRLRVAADAGYLRNLEEKRGVPARWKITDLDDPLPEALDLLPEPKQLQLDATL
jgi:hypothetical protein